MLEPFMCVFSRVCMKCNFTKAGVSKGIFTLSSVSRGKNLLKARKIFCERTENNRILSYLYIVL